LKGLWAKYNYSPLGGFAGPLANMAIFVPMFFGLRKMGDFVPGE
jgi:membrane protein insertase Oxa1/YidC/SpoIIIJ